MNRNVGQASRLPSAVGATLFGRYAARAGESPALRPDLVRRARMLNRFGTVNWYYIDRGQKTGPLADR